MPSSNKNSDIIKVNFTIGFPQNSPVPSKLSIVFPLELDISSASCDIICTKIANKIDFIISSWSSTLFLSINNVINGQSYKPIGNFELLLVGSNGFSSLYQSVSSWVNNIPSSFGTSISSGDAYRG